MVDVTTLREFLVVLGMKVDEGGKKKMLDALASVTLKAAELGAGIKAAALTVEGAVAKIADGMERLYFASQRTNAAVGNIQAMGFAAANMGSSATAAQASLENLAHFMRSAPGAAGVLNRLGVATQIDGHARDATEIMSDLGKKFAQMPLNSGRGQAYASLLGIDDRTFLAMREGMGQFSAQYKQMAAAVGFDADKAAKSSHYFMTELRTLGAAITILVQKVASELTGRMGFDIGRLRALLVENFARISHAITIGITYLISVADVITRLAVRAGQAMSDLAGWFGGLSTSSKHVIEALGLLVIAWRAFNLAFEMTPFGLVMTGIASLIAAGWLLYDDYKTWKEGGQSLIDWGKWKPGIDATIAAIGDLTTWFDGLSSSTKYVIEALAALAIAWRVFNVAFARTPIGAIIALVGLLAGAIVYLTGDYQKWQATGDSLIDWSKWKHGIDEAIAGIKSLLTAFENLGFSLPGYYDNIIKLARNFWTTYGADVRRFGVMVGHDISEAITSITRVVTDGVKAVAALLHGDFSGAWGDAKDAFSTVATFIEDRFTALRDTIGDIIDDIVGKFDIRKWAQKLDAGGRWLISKMTGFIFPSASAAEPATSGTARHIGVSGRAPPDALNKARDYFVSQGWSVVQAAGLVSNLLAESGMNPTAENPTSHAQGIAQWLGSRKAEIEAKYNKPIDQIPFQQQLEFVQYELTHGEANAGAKLRAAQTPGDAAYVVDRFYERNGEDYAHSARIGKADSLARDNVSINQTTNIHVAAGPNSQDTTERVTRAQNRVNADMVRNTKAKAA